METQLHKTYVEKLSMSNLFWFVETACVNMLRDEVKRPELIDLNTLYQLSSKSMSEGTAFIVKCNGEPIGALASLILPSPFNPNIKSLVEMVWYVLPEYRNTRAAALLLFSFEEEAKRLKMDSILSLLSSSTINEKTLKKREFIINESAFIKRYKET